MARKAEVQSYDVLMPRLCRAGSGEVFSAGSYVRKAGELPSLMQAARLPGGSIGVHAAAIDGTASLCNCALMSATKDTTPVVVATDTPRKRGEAAKAVTCKFCLARLINAGALAADDVSSATPAASKAFAIDYGTRVAADELAAIDTRAAEAAAEAKAAADALAAAEAKAAAKAAREAKAAAKAAAAAEAKPRTPRKRAASKR